MKRRTINADERILLGHGSGGTLTHSLIDELFIKEFDNPVLDEKADAAKIVVGRRKIAFTTDSYVVNPLFFPGGDIGSLAVYGTVNDLAVCGARPRYISLGLVIEEGLERGILERIIRSIAAAAQRAGVAVVTGDTKVVERGACDKLFITTSGIGEIINDRLSIKRIRVGDAVIVSGGLGEHAISVLSQREGIDFGTRVRSDSQPLAGLIAGLLAASSSGVRFMRDPTRGGLGTTLNEAAVGATFGIELFEKDIPVGAGVRGACEFLGYDPLYLACEGRVVVITAEKAAAKVLAAMRRDPAGRGSRVIGRVTREHRGKVFLTTSTGGRRLVDMLAGDQLPRIC